MIDIILNGETTSIDSNIHLEHLVKTRKFTTQQFAVAINGEFVPRSEYSNTVINANDEIDIVSPVGGG